MSWFTDIRKCYKQYGCWNKKGIVKVFNAVICAASNGEPAPQTFSGEVEGFYPNVAGVLAGNANFGHPGWDPDDYPYDPQNIGETVNPACGPDGKGFGTLIINPNIPSSAQGATSFDMTFTQVDNSAGWGAMFAFCRSTGQISPYVTVPSGGLGTNTGPVSYTSTFNISSLNCPVEDIRIGISAWGAQSGGSGNCDEIDPNPETIVVTAPSKCATARECFKEQFLCYPEEMMPSVQQVVKTLYEYRDIWAEESAAGTTNNAEWSFGNGATGNIGLPVDDGWELEALGYNADVYPAGAVIRVQLMDYQNTAPVGLAVITLGSSTDGGGQTNNASKYFPVSVPIPNGAVLGFRTISASAGISDHRVSARLRRKVGDFNEVV